MSNTTLQIRHSTVAGNVPSSLANGEIALNSRDGRLFYSTPAGVVTSFSTGPSGLDTEIQFNDAGSVGGSEKLTFNKTTGLLTVNGTVRANIFSDDGVDLYDFSNRAFNTANAAFAAANSGSGIGITWKIINANTTANTTEGFLVDTTTANVYITLNSSPSLGNTARIVDMAGNFAINNCIIKGNGSKVMGSTDDFIISSNNAGIGLVYSNATYGWRIIENP
jgi:hypothetical protein